MKKIFILSVLAALLYAGAVWQIGGTGKLRRDRDSAIKSAVLWEKNYHEMDSAFQEMNSAFHEMSRANSRNEETIRKYQILLEKASR